ncbi:MAG TPA: hemolysin III family protein [Thermoanaerobaculia bacterium]|jgi:hemolysin III|nr:hemolysin III family protein [Thermoanaerobaculia bacterium]
MVTPENTKPLLRGTLHQSAAWYAFGAGSMLVTMAGSPRAAMAAGIYSLSLVTLFAVSAVYHRVQWRAAASRAWMRRADHASIFVLIAGTYTPIAVLSIGGADGRRLLILIWSGAAAGVLLSLFWVTAPKVLTSAVAVAVGWTIVPYFAQVHRLLGAFVWLVLAGGLAYTAGAVVYALRRPDPWPRVFGYHEVFHALTLVGAALHFVTVVTIVR